MARELSLLRVVAQGLVGLTSAPDVSEAVRRQLAVQGQQVSSLPHALLSRTPGARRSDVDAAFAVGRLVRSWPMRGTVHVTTAEDHHWLREVLLHRSQAWSLTAGERLGVGEEQLELAARTATGLVAAEGPLPRARLVEAWQEVGLLDPAEGAGSFTEGSGRRRHLLVQLHRRGVLVQGPRAGNEHLVVDARALPDATHGPGGTGGAARGAPGHRAALAEVARRYATSHGPVTAADLARWTTLPLGEAVRALEDAVEVTQAAHWAQGEVDAAARGLVPLTRARVEDALTGRVRVTGGGAAAAPAVGERERTFYLRADLPDLLEQARTEARGTFFLASFDELHVGYRTRGCLTDEAGERLVCPGSNGMFRPLLVDRGRVVAVRPVGEGLLWAASARRSARLDREVDRAVRLMGERLAG